MPPTRSKRAAGRPKRYRSPEVEQPVAQPLPEPAQREETQPSQPDATLSQTAISTIEANVARTVIRELLDMGILPNAPNTQTPHSSSTPEPPSDLQQTTQPMIDIANLHQGQCSTQSEPSNLPSFRPVSLQLGATLPPKLKSKIWAGEFVELTALGQKQPEPPMSITLANGSTKHTVAISSGKPTTISSVAEWTDLFLIYAAVYTERHPHQAPQLMKYCSVVRSMAGRCSPHWWLYYDTQFRQLKAQDPSMSWADTHPELYLHCLAQTSMPFRSSPYANRQNQQRQHQRRGPDGVCWKQYFTGKCEFKNCRFSHEKSNGQTRSQNTTKTHQPQSDRQSKSTPQSSHVARQPTGSR